MRVHVVGNVCIDTTFRLDRLPEAGETRNAASHTDGLGGKGANQAVAAAHTGAPVTLWAAIGRDANGGWVRDVLAGEVDSTCLTEFDLPTDRSTVAVDATGENIILSGVSCALAFNPLAQTDLGETIESGDVLVMQGNLASAITDACLCAAREKGLVTIFNASPLALDVPPRFDNADFVIVNEGEAQSISGSQQPEDAAARIRDLGASCVIVTLGSRGCLVLGSGGVEPVYISPPKVAVVDTSGAGDVLCGIFAGCLAKGMRQDAALRVAVATSALAVTRVGTLASCPSVNEISLLIKQSETESA
ncbi:ribokinase [Agrobacterium rubi]|uniref:Ribokinase n=1 Tax=Agrobacterium rubi TaxID=28099 RepID=A0AAE7R6S0_9HYPH|nr:ribokinase [Agrobacterium rubi]NTE88394.1 ribokinase [Agrobacterium rubi]NTF04160.1 ribokinase [Agrobacterium rubi]NTF09574.1 ribokinase [Agrobacterium rubi]NTF22481.1 ribokinase [Agrobacterium rubi]NTF29338.1 ribokinase [Agrobacterium rubi]